MNSSIHYYSWRSVLLPFRALLDAELPSTSFPKSWSASTHATNHEYERCTDGSDDKSYCTYRGIDRHIEICWLVLL